MSPPPPRRPPLRVVPAPQLDPNLVYATLANLDVRLAAVEARLAGLFKKSVVTIVLADVVVGIAKLVLEHWPK